MKKHPLAHAAFLGALLIALSLNLRATEKNYFLGDASAIHAQTPPPPADDSPAGMADLETLLQVQKDRTPEQIARANRIAKHSAMLMGSTVFGPDFTKENFPRTYAIMKALGRVRSKSIGNGKKDWNRPRPYVRSKEIVVCTYIPTSTSYPSAHSASGAFWGTLFSTAFPAYTPVFDAAIRETMWCRVLAGVHYPTDTIAGRALGTRVAREMLKAPDTQAVIQEIRDEVAAYLKTHPEMDALAKQRLAALKAQE